MLLAAVGLSQADGRRRIDELSNVERQWVALARMLAYYGEQLDAAAAWCEAESHRKSLAQMALLDAVSLVVEAQT